MMALENLIPYSKNNAISETVFTLFLEQPIVKPEEFVINANTVFNGFFHQNQLITSRNISINELGKPQNVSDEISGFLFKYFENGNERWLLKADKFGEIQRVSLHCLLYKDWNDYKSNVLKIFKEISDFRKDLFVRAYSLSYIDQFDWMEDSEPPMNEIFKQSEMLPNILLKSNETWNYSVQITKKSEINNIEKSYTDRIDAALRKKETNYNILLAHNTIQELNSPETINNLFNDSLIDTLLDFAHKNNKKIVNTILTEPVTHKMGMNKNKI
jgi:uncharacterized protein (TIGR04255 family)